MAKLKGKPPLAAQKKKVRAMCWGGPGVGKSWVTTTFPLSLYIDCEGGVTRPHYLSRLEAAGALYVGQEDGANDFDTVIEQVQLLATTAHDRRWVIIDSLSKLFATEVQLERERLISSHAKTDFGQDRKTAVAKTRRLIYWLDRMDIGAWFVCHDAKDWDATPDSVSPFTHDCYRDLAFELDLVLQVLEMGPLRKARVTKSRIESFKLNSIIDWDYKTFEQLYGKSDLDSQVAQIKLATEEQVRLCSQLADAVKLPDKDRIKWWNKAQVESWEEMDQDQIQKCIDYLKKQIPA